MALVVNTNVASITSQMYVNQTNKDMGDTMARLSSGKRINTAADDAAGMAIASRMEAQVKGLNQAIRNANDGQSLIDTTEGAHQEIANALQRMRELAVQAANDTNVAGDRANLQSEISQLKSEIARIAGQTTWNGMSLLDGTFSSKSFQIGADSDQTVTFSVNAVAPTSIGSFTQESLGVITEDAANTITADHGASTDLTVTGHLGSSTVTVAANLSAKSTAALFNNVTADTGVEATAVTKLKLSGLDYDSINSGTISFNLNGVSISATGVVEGTDGDLRTLVTAINAKSAQTGVTAEITGSSGYDEILLVDADGDDIKITDFDTNDTDADGTTQTSKITAQVLKADGVSTTGSSIDLMDAGRGGAATGTYENIIATGTVTLKSGNSFNVTDSGASLTTTAGDVFNGGSVSQATIASLSVTDASNAANAITAIDGALNFINKQRADLGALSNRLDNSMSNLANISANVQSSRSRIEDADFAAESANLAKQQIMLQAGTAMLAQANASQQNVLSLLG